MMMSEKGFTLIEIAIVMIIIGILAGAGISLIGVLTKKKLRDETIDYLEKSKDALISFASINGRLPWADTDGDGVENSGGTSGNLPYSTLNLMPTDSYKRPVKYEVNSNLTLNRQLSCGALRAGISGNPRVVDSDGSTSAFSVSAILISSGPMDADGDGNLYDAINTGTHQGDNTDGVPNYIRHPPIDTFDDLVRYIGTNELYKEICEFLVLAVNNNSAGTIYVYNATAGADLGSISSGGNGSYDIISGTRIEIRDAPSGGGSIVTSTPPTPIILSGNGCTINVP